MHDNKAVAVGSGFALQADARCWQSWTLPVENWPSNHRILGQWHRAPLETSDHLGTQVQPAQSFLAVLTVPAEAPGTAVLPRWPPTKLAWPCGCVQGLVR